MPRRSALLAAGALAIAAVAATPPAFGAAKTTKPKSTAKPGATPTTKAPTKPAAGRFTPQQVAGKYRWVKSTVAIKFADGKTGGGDVPYGPNDTITFVMKSVPGTKLHGAFTITTETFGTSNGTWFLQDGSVLAMIHTVEGAVDNTYSFRRIEQLDGKRLTMSADDALIVRAFTENGLNTGVANDVVGGSAFDDLSRVK